MSMRAVRAVLRELNSRDAAELLDACEFYQTSLARVSDDGKSIVFYRGQRVDFHAYESTTVAAI